MKTDIILLTYMPDKSLFTLLDAVKNQNVEIGKIIIVNTEQKYFDRLIYSTDFNDKYRDVRVRHVSKREFDSGKTRNIGVSLSDADYFLMISQYALPRENNMIEKMFATLLTDSEIAVVSARQVPREDCTEADKYQMRYYFPAETRVFSNNDIDEGAKIYSCSNTCALYRRSIFDKLGGFLNHTIRNEDILFAAKAIHEGYKVGYAGDATVEYSKKLTNRDYLERSFDFAVSYAKHPEIFNFDEIKKAKKELAKKTLSHLRRSGFTKELFSFRRANRLMMKGFRLGKKYKTLPKKTILKCTGNKGYWSYDELLRNRKAVDVHSGYGRSEEEIRMIADSPIKKQNETNS